MLIMPNCDHEFVYMIENYLYLNFSLCFLMLLFIRFTNGSSTQVLWQCFITVLVLRKLLTTYEVTLRNRMNESQVLQLNTTQANVSISHKQIPSYLDACAIYSWSLVAIVEDKRSPTAQYSKDVSIPSSK